MSPGLLHAARRLAIVAAAALAAACGGGAYVSFGNVDGGWNGSDGDGDGAAPSVELAAAGSAAYPGESVRLVAAANDDRGIDRVDFYRVDRNGYTGLGSDASRPYTWDAQIPLDAVGSVRFVARATDVSGRSTESTPVTLAVIE